jgi:hypothetical protein
VETHQAPLVALHGHGSGDDAATTVIDSSTASNRQS